MNMSYCRFRNTRNDLADCLDAITQGDTISTAERIAGERMFKSFLTFCRDWDIIDGYDAENLKDMFDEICEEEEEEEDDD